MMHFNVPDKPEKESDLSSLEVGNVYACKGGNKTKYWVVIGLDAKAVHLIGINGDGVITSTASYGRHVFEGHGNIFKGRELLGHVSGLDQLNFDVVWNEEGATA